MTIIVKTNVAAEYSYIPTCGHQRYIRHKTRVFLGRNQGSTPFADADTQNVKVTYNFW